MLRFRADFKGGNDRACERKASEFHGGWVERKRERRKEKKFAKKKGRNRAEKKMEEERCGREGRGLGAIAWKKCSSTVSLKEYDA